MLHVHYTADYPQTNVPAEYVKTYKHADLRKYSTNR